MLNRLLWDWFERYRGASRAKEELVKEMLTQLFPSFKDEIAHMRVRHNIEAIPILYQTDPKFREHYVGAIYAYGGKTVPFLRDLEEYFNDEFARGLYSGGRTILASYFPTRSEIPVSDAHSVHVHEFIHYITQRLLNQRFGRATRLSVSERYVPTDVREALAFAFQHTYLEDRGVDVDHNKVVRRAVAKYSSEGPFNADRFKRVYFATLAAIRTHGYDGAARRIPDIVAEHTNIAPRKGFKRR
ncbi:MAG: hypothetical protein GXN93_04395 [Candidatus Diapherotrites archaeon]|nr:hypothetical protein [Candidatus Diapherotrites archaeon]